AVAGTGGPTVADAIRPSGSIGSIRAADINSLFPILAGPPKGARTARYHLSRKLLPMSLKSDPELGVNSWFEDELYQQYLHDRSTVDESWKRLFQEPRAAQESTPVQAPSQPPAAPEGELQPLR